jgi:hypothetical protein
MTNLDATCPWYCVVVAAWHLNVTPIFYKNNFFVNIEVYIGCISIYHAHEKPSKINLAYDYILYFSKILEEPRRI